MTSEPTTTPPPLDLHPAADEVARIVAGVRDDHLGGTTPCPDYPVAALLDHLMGLCIAFTQAARKQPLPADGGSESAPATPTADHLAPTWREQLPVRLQELAAAWDEPGAWAGEATAGGVTMPAPAMGAVALDEVAVHGWDLARATGQDHRLDDATVAAVLAFTTESATPENEPMRAGVFGPVVEVPADAPAWDRAMGLAGRDPGWRP
jgi:uncharacterized protein (TIGR03086 family)